MHWHFLKLKLKKAYIKRTSSECQFRATTPKIHSRKIIEFKMNNQQLLTINNLKKLFAPVKIELFLKENNAKSSSDFPMAEYFLIKIRVTYFIFSRKYISNKPDTSTEGVQSNNRQELREFCFHVSPAVSTEMTRSLQKKMGGYLTYMITYEIKIKMVIGRSYSMQWLCVQILWILYKYLNQGEYVLQKRYISQHMSCIVLVLLGFPGGSVIKKNPPAEQETKETQVQSLGQKDPLEEEMTTSILAWISPWTEEPGSLQFIESQRVRHN